MSTALTTTLRTIAAAFAVACLAGCSSQDVNNLKGDTNKLGRDIGPAVSGAALDAKIHTHLTLTKGIDISGLHIEPSGSTVIVSGHVRDSNMRKKVIEVVRETPGVEKVVDKLNVEK